MKISKYYFLHKGEDAANKKELSKMDIFFAYLLFSSATPLFLWKEKRTLAIFHIPVIAAMWGVFLAYLNYDLGALGNWLFGAFFVINIIIAHLTIFHVFVKPFFKGYLQRFGRKTR